MWITCPSVHSSFLQAVSVTRGVATKSVVRFSYNLVSDFFIKFFFSSRAFCENQPGMLLTLIRVANETQQVIATLYRFVLSFI